MKKAWNKPVIEILDVSMTMKFFPPGHGHPGEPPPPIDPLDS
ncbi:paeninodin family lasso peptide [Peribacillus cavernae]|nr:hypothetical protein [Peribacillus cavernae]